MPLTSVGHYRLDELIGLGGMGEVFRAFDTKLNRPVAVKIMRSAGNAPGVQRFLREARAASALNHPNIVVIHDVGETETGEQFIVQELIAGRTLRLMLETPLPLVTIVDVGGQTAKALAAAHAAGIVHRDIKPENIMIRDDGYVKVLDFGLARMVELDADTAEITRASFNTESGTLLGTPSYMSPEQASGRPTGPPSDVFALGVVLYEMAGGRRPFVAPTSIGVITSIVSEQPVPLAHVNPEIPLALDDLIQRMLDKDPQRRPSASDVQRELAAPVGVADVIPGQAPSRTTVGRDAQREQLWRAYRRVRDGKSVIVAVTGEPGIGKTSLIEEFLAELPKAGERPTLARGRCSERLAGAEAYLPILEALDSLIHRHAGPSLTGVLKAVAPSWYKQVATHSLEPTAIVADIREATAAVSQERMKRELGALLLELSRTQPLVVFIDDLHWADVSTIDMLNYLAGRFADMRVLVLGSYRPSEMALARHPFLAIRGDLESRGLFEEVGLGFLEPADVDRYLALQFPGHHFPDDFGAVIHAKTEGSPLFMADLVRYFHDTGGIVQEDGTWALAHSLPDSPRELPASVRGMIQRKIDQVEERDLKLLVAASVQGHWFDSTIVGEALEMDPADVEERLDALERVHVLVRRGDESEFRDRAVTLNYQFVHVLYQNVLYASLQPTRRAALSGRIARALVTHHGDQVGTVAARVAVLFEAARDFSAASKYFNAAARRSFELLAFREALSLAERGLHALHGLPEGPARQQQEVALQMTRGTALRSTSGWATAEIEGVFTRARQLCAELGDPPALLPVLWATTLFLMIRGNLRECRDRADELMTLAKASGEQAYIMVAHHIGGVVREFIGDLVESNRLLERCRELHVPAEHSTYVTIFGQDPGMTARAMSSRPWWALGYPDRALERARETLTLARSQGQPLSLAFALVVTQGIHLYRGEAEAAVAMGDEILALCREYELPQEAEWSIGFQGFAFHLLGRTGEGIEALRSSLAVQHIMMGSDLVRPAFLALLAEALLHAGRIDEGLTAIDEGFEHAERTSEGGYVAELHRLRGELLRASGNEARAEESLREAVAYAGRQHAKSLELRAASSLARLFQSAQRAGDARAILAPVYEWFTEGHNTADLVGARILLSEIG